MSFGSHIPKTRLFACSECTVCLDLMCLMLKRVCSEVVCVCEVIKAVFQQWSGMQPNVSSPSLIRPQDEQPSITEFFL